MATLSQLLSYFADESICIETVNLLMMIVEKRGYELETELPSSFEEDLRDGLIGDQRLHDEDKFAYGLGIRPFTEADHRRLMSGAERIW
jgi:hypothetical protein